VGVYHDTNNHDLCKQKEVERRGSSRAMEAGGAGGGAKEAGDRRPNRMRYSSMILAHPSKQTFFKS